MNKGLIVGLAFIAFFWLITKPYQIEVKNNYGNIQLFECKQVIFVGKICREVGVWEKAIK